jgi:hypothetical protein
MSAHSFDQPTGAKHKRQQYGWTSDLPARTGISWRAGASGFWLRLGA